MSDKKPWEEDYSAPQNTSIKPWEEDYSQSSQPKESERKALSDIGNSIASGAAAAGRGILGLSDLITGSNSIQNTKNLGLDIKSSEQAWKDNLSEKAKQEEQAWNNTQGFVDTLKYGATHPFAVANKVAESLPAMAVSGGMGGAVAKGVVGGAIGEGMQQAGSSYADAIEKNNGNTPTDKDAGAALGSGVTTGTISALSGGLAKKLGIGDIDTAIANRVAGEAAASARPLGLGAYAKNIGEGIITEGALEELPQSATEQMWQNYADDKSIMEGAPEAAAQGLITGGLMGGAFNATNLPTFNESQNDQGNQGGQGQSNGPMPEVLPPDGSNGLPNNVQPNTFDGSYRDLTPTNAPQLTNDQQPQSAASPSNNTPSSETSMPSGLGLNLLQFNNTTSETPEVQAGNLSPSQELGIDPNQGGLSSAAAVAVDTGASPITAELQRQATQSQPNEQANWLNGIASPTAQNQNEAPQLGYSPSENTDTPPVQQAQVADLWNSQDPQQRMAILGGIYGNEDMARQNALASFDRLPKPAQQQIADIAVQNGAVSEDSNTQSSNGQTTQAAPQAPLTALAQDIAPASQANAAPAIEPILGKDGKNKWFATQNKADEFIQKKSLGDNYTIEQTGKMRYEIVPKAVEQAPVQETQRIQQAYSLPSKTKKSWTGDTEIDITGDWQSVYENGKPDERQQMVINATQQALDEGLYSNEKITNRVAEILDVPKDILQQNADRVEGGYFGSDVYAARQYIGRQKRDDANNQSKQKLNLQTGQSIGTLVTDTGKTLKNAIVEKADDSQISVIATVGNKKSRFTVNYTDVDNAISRAVKDGKRQPFKEPKLYGKESYIQTGSERQPTRVAVVEADSLVPDDKNTDNQFRDRTRSASQMQIDSIANNLDPRQLTDSTTMATGSPTLANDGKTIIAGNGRTKAIKQAYAQGKGAEYKQSLIEQAQSLGIDPQQIAGMKNPVLVKEFANPVDVKKMAIESNATGGLAMSAKEQARADSALMPDMSMLASDDKGNINLSRNAPLFRKFISSLPVEAQASMLDKDGLLSKEGLSRLQNAVLYKAYGDSKAFDDMVENTDVDVKNAINGLTQVAPKIAQTKESINKGTSYDADISDDITAALSLLQQIRKNEMSVSDYLSQMGLFDDGLSPVAKEFIQYIDANIRSAKAIADLLSAYYDNLDSLGNPNQQDLLGGKPNTDKQSLFKQALEQVRNAKQPTKQQTDLFSQSDADTAGQPANQTDNAVEQRSSQSQSDGAGVGTNEVAKPSDEQVKTALKELVTDDVWSGEKALIISPSFVQKVADQLGYQGDTQNNADGTMSDFAKQVNDAYSGMIKNQANLSNQKAKDTPQPSKTEVYADELEKWVANTKSAAEFARSVISLMDSQLPKGVNVDFYNFIAQAIGAKSPQTIGFRIKLEEYWLAANDTKNNNAQSTNKYEKFQSPIISDDTFENTQQQTNGAKEIKFESNKNYQFEYDVNAALDADGFNQEGDFLRLDYKNKNQPLSAAKAYGARVFFSYNQTTGKVSSIVSVYTDSTHKRSIEITNEPNNQYPKVKFETEFYKPLFDVVAKDERAFQDYIDSGKWQAEKDAKREQIKQNFIDNKPAIFTDLAKKYMSASLVGAAGVKTAEQFRDLSDDVQAEAFAKMVEQTGYTPPRKKAKPTNVKEGIAKTRAKKQTAKAKPSEPKYSQMGVSQEPIKLKRGDIAIKSEILNDGKKFIDFYYRNEKLSDFLSDNPALQAYPQLGDIKVESAGFFDAAFGYDKENNTIRVPMTFTNKQMEQGVFTVLKDEVANLQKGMKPAAVTTQTSNVSKEQDKTYLDLATRYEQGDTSVEPQLREMINKVAQDNGFDSDTSFRMSHAAPVNDGFNDSADNLSNMFGEDIYSNNALHYFGMGDEYIKADRESLQAINRAKGKPNTMVTVYRAMPKDAKGTAIGNGDWVTTSKEYAKEHGNHALNGDYKIVSRLVPAKHLFNNGDSIHEWGVDTGQDLLRSKTVDREKLSDLITYDDKGKIIPLSKRFNAAKKDMRYSESQGETGTTKAQVIKTLSDKFGKATIDKLIADGNLEIIDYAEAKRRNPKTPSNADGYYADGKAVLIADNLFLDMIIPTFLHELGGHGGLQTLMSDKAYQSLMKEFDRMVAEGNQLAKDAKAFADATSPNAKVAQDEYLPYLISLAARAQGNSKVKSMINRIVMAVKSFIRDKFGVNLKVTPADIVALSEKMVSERAMQGNVPANMPAQFSKQTPQTEIDQVRQQYEGTEQWMKAPNGKPTNLTEQQWLQVRTPSFKAWFGDWENSPKSASKVVDENGEPLVVYHGTPSNYNEFNEFIVYNEGVFFTANKSTSDRYAGMRGDKGTVKAIYLNIKKPKAIRSVGYEFDGFLGADAKLKKMSKALEDKNPGYSRAPYRYKELLRENLSNKGFDGLVLDDHSWEGVIENDSQYVVFNPNQIKSATDNIGTFNPENNDIRYSQMGGSQAQQNKLTKALTEFFKNPLSFAKTVADNKYTDNLGKALALLGRRQLVDIYKKDLPPIKEYSDIVEQMDADSNEKAYEADKLVKEWGKLKDELPLAELMHDATLKGIDPAEAYQAGDDRALYNQLRRRYDALSPDAKRIYKQARDDYKAQQRSVFEAIKGRIQRTDMSAPRQAELIRKMEQGFFFGQKVYFPLARFGNYVVAVKDAAGDIISASRAETKGQADELRKELIAQYPNDKVGRVMLDKEFVSSRDGVTRGFMSDLFDAVDKLNISSQERAEFEDTLGQLYLNSLPDISFAKSGMHRKGTPGFSQNARRAYAQHMSRGSHYIAKMRHSDVLQAKLDEMQEYVKAQGEADPNYDQPKMQRVVDEMEKRHESLMNNHTAGWSSLATSIGFMWYMGLSPASALVNLSQTALVAYPVMGAKWGFAKASKELLIASRQASKALNNLQSSLSGDEKTAFDEAVKRGVIDMTQAHDLAGVARGEDDSVMWKIRKPMEWASFMFHHAEKFNRQVAFIASYRLAKQAGANHKQAIEQAIDATYEGHFSYAASNRPRIMQGDWARVFLLFKQYGQNMVYTLSRNAYLSAKGDKQAMKTLAGMLALHGTFAGVLGLPLATTLLGFASALGGDDDEPWDAEIALRNYLAELLGDGASEVISKGLPRALGIDLSSRVGLDSLILPRMQEGLEGQRAGESFTAAMTGPVAGIGVNAIAGFSDIQKAVTPNEYLIGTEKLLPKAFRDLMKTYRLAAYGNVDKTGIEIVPQENISLSDVGQQALGFRSGKIAQAQEGKSAIYKMDKEIGSRRQRLMNRYAKAYMAGDVVAADEAWQDIKRFNAGIGKDYPKLKITKPKLMQSIKQRRRRIEDAEDGIYLPSSREASRQYGSFATE